VSDAAAAQTAAALEHLVIAVYAEVAQLAAVGALVSPAAATLAAVMSVAVQQHADHLAAFNAAAVRLGGKAQQTADQAVAQSVVRPALTATTAAADAVALLAKIEQVAAETYAADVTAVADAQLRASFAGVAGVECQHQAVLLVIGALLEANAPELVSFPLDAVRLPVTLPGDGAPAPFLRTDQARPASEGAVR